MLKEFRYSRGYVFENTEEGKVLIWHSCSNKPLCILTDRFYFNAEYAKRCPNCGKSITNWAGIGCTDREDCRSKSDVYLHFSDTSLIRINSYDDIISVGIFESDYNLWRGSSVFKKSTYYKRIAINVKTGYTYSFSRDALGKKHGFWKSKNIVNVSYLGLYTYLPPDVLDCLQIEINKKMKIVHGDDVPSFDSYKLETTLDNLIYYVRCPFINPLQYNEMIARSRLDGEVLPRHRDIIVKNTCREPIEQILSQSKIPAAKSLRRIAYSNVNGLPLLAALSRSFQNVDIIRSLYWAFIDCCDEEMHSYIDFSNKLFKVMIRHRNEQIIASKLLSFKRSDRNNNAYRTLYDTIRCYSELKQCDFDFSKPYTINELHSYLSTQVSKREKENRVIDYDSNDLTLEMSDGKLAVSLAKDTNELVDVGLKLNICVGSYGDKAVNKHCTILVLRRLENSRTIGCIELRKSNVVQVKGAHNQLFRGNELEFVENWVAEKSLTAVTMDLRSPEAQSKRAAIPMATTSKASSTIDYSSLKKVYCNQPIESDNNACQQEILPLPARQEQRRIGFSC